jgi:uncharacterized protein (TIGR02058 family)
MARKRFIVELGTGVDLHGEDVTEACCRAVRDAISRSCLCGLLEILEMPNLDGVEVEILLACPKPEAVDLEKVKEQVPIGRKTATAVTGGLQTRGICVPRFGPACDQIMMANCSVTVWVNS